MKKRCHISMIFIMLSLCLGSFYHIYYYFMDKSSEDLISNYYESGVINKSYPQKIVEKVSNSKEEYYGIISIPKIKLKTGFYDKDSKKNDVNQSVMLLKDSVMPGENGSIIYLAAHSGTGHLAYFKNINKLTNGDNINLLINNHHYQYSIFDYYEVVKNGTITINHNINENYLVLTTCSNNKNMQLVIIAKMISKI